MKTTLYILLFSFSTTLFAQTWVVRNNFSGAVRNNSSACSFQGKGYMIFGVNGTTNNLKEVWEYSPLTDSWTQKNDYPGPVRRGAVLVSNDTLVFAGIGGTISTNYYDFKQYYPLTDSWSSRANYPGNGGFLPFAAIYEGCIYVGGGAIRSTGSYKKDFWKYEIATDTWSNLGNLPFGNRNSGFCIESNGILYLGMGRDGSTSFNDLWAYYPKTNSWSQKTSLPGTDRMHPNVFLTKNNEFIVGGGFKLFGPSLGDYFKYNPITDSWSSISSSFTNSNRSLAAEFTINDIGYLVGGIDSSLTNDLKDVWSYKPHFVTNTIETNTTVTNLKIFPIPTSDFLTLQFENNLNSTQFELIDIEGEIVLTKEFTGGSINARIDLSDLPSGFYIYQLKSHNSIESGKISLIRN